MSLSTILLALFLVVFGFFTGFGLGFDYSHLVLGVLALAAGVLLFCRK